MDAIKEHELEEDQPSPSPPKSSRQFTVYTYPKHKTKKRKSHIIKIKRPQIHQDSPKPSSPSTELVLYNNSSKSTSYKQKRVVVNEFYDNTETKSSPTERAKELQASLDSSFPSFAKCLVRSNVKVGFWMHLPMPFCKLHLPKNDTVVSVETENGQEYKINYIAERTALSGGWKAFCSSNQLHEGDVLVFHLLEPLRFKVYIVRGTVSAEANAEVEKVEAPEKQTRSVCLTIKDQAEIDGKNNERVKEEEEEKSLMVLDEGHGMDQPENGTEGHPDSKALEVIASSGSGFDFKDVDSIESFSIVINGLAIDSEISDHQRTKYYELCCSQNSFLHENLLKSINYKLATEIIIGTVNISEAIRASKLSCSNADFAVWDKTLKGFELLGMNVGFLRSRLSRLMTLAMESEEAVESESREVRQGQARVNEEMQSLAFKLLELKEARDMLDAEIESLKANAERHEHKFQEAVNAPW
ncbi:B3 domain-containing protein Os01g0234100 [Ricinus communis]|uniref:TF-B3 domain-containing protein n=1 Tax=Ricinus communis TaxID=3988 RepID=B9RYJ8_RICCO|nr:B3 domain-containing protein Os01g0234100 [Ricinus communis]EEF43707.1 conserved hypothetical protein [Ricinus communis]|eukprot:XP_002518782.1 B3 domain-containing protein Os01g0234100 [Ricinus communis]